MDEKYGKIIIMWVKIMSKLSTLRTVLNMNFWNREFIAAVMVLYMILAPFFMGLEWLLFKFTLGKDYDILIAWQAIILGIVVIYFIILAKLIFSIIKKVEKFFAKEEQKQEQKQKQEQDTNES